MEEEQHYQKWFRKLDKIKSGEQVNNETLKYMVRGGIPGSMRGVAWSILSKSDEESPQESQKGRRQKWMQTLLSK